MNRLLNIYKPKGLTPLQLINKLKSTKAEYKNLKLAYAGRLDPMAHGVMLLMIDEQTKNRDLYLGLNKTYEFEILFGITSDTYDTLGIINDDFKNSRKVLKNKINDFINSKIGKQIQLYPPYSSIEVRGKPLFKWARENKLDEITFPSREIEIYKFELLEIKNEKMEIIKKRIIENINLVEGDFRQAEILKNWEIFFNNNLTLQQSKYLITAKFRINCSSGTYVRSLANELGQKLKCGAIALDILRTKVGKYKLEQSVRI